MVGKYWILFSNKLAKVNGLLTPKSLLQSKCSEPAPNKSDMIVAKGGWRKLFIFSFCNQTVQNMTGLAYARVLCKNPGCELVSHAYHGLRRYYWDLQKQWILKLEVQLKIENTNSRLDLIEIHIDHSKKYHNILVIILFVGHSAKILHKHCLQFLLGVKWPQEKLKNSAYAKFWQSDQQTVLRYVMVFSGVVNSRTWLLWLKPDFEFCAR